MIPNLCVYFFTFINCEVIKWYVHLLAILFTLFHFLKFPFINTQNHKSCANACRMEKCSWLSNNLFTTKRTSSNFLVKFLLASRILISIPASKRGFHFTLLGTRDQIRHVISLFLLKFFNHLLNSWRMVIFELANHNLSTNVVIHVCKRKPTCTNLFANNAYPSFA